MAASRNLQRSLLVLVTILGFAGTGLLRASEPSGPNFIVISIDDLGYADVGPFGSKINRTPNLDRMAQEGRKLTSFYAAPVCSPSRAALMTGCYPKRCLPIPHVLFPNNDVGLSPKEVTVAEVLKGAGYRTAIIGKWHLGDQPDFLPNRQGFDLHFGLPYSNDMGPAADGVKSDLGKPLPKTAGAGQPPLPLLRNETVLQRVLPDDQQALVERYTTEAQAFIAANRSRPFFLYLAHNAVHFPIYPGKKWAGKSPHGLFSDWVEEVDWSVGQVLDAVRANDLSEKTLVIFTSDNGGTPRSVNAPLRGNKGSTFEGGIRVPTIAWWPGKVPAGTESDAILGMFDILPTFAALAGGKVPADRKMDGANIWPQLAAIREARPAHETFYYYRGLRLEAVRHGDWKLQIAGPLPKDDPKNAPFKPRLCNLRADIGETKDVAAEHPEIVQKLQGLVAAMKDDLGLDGPAPGCRELGKVPDARPLIDRDGKVRPGFEPNPMGNVPPQGFRALFNGKDLHNWRGQIAEDPRDVAKITAGLSREEIDKKQEAADQATFAHWTAEDGVIHYDGTRRIGNIETREHFGDFELYLDWKIPRGGDSGVFPRSMPQVQIWDPAGGKRNVVGSGGLDNNGPDIPPKKKADKPVGEWNTFTIKMVGDRIWVKLNGETVIDGEKKGNYWKEFKEPPPAKGPIVLQSHGSHLWFRNLFLRELNGK